MMTDTYCAIVMGLGLKELLLLVLVLSLLSTSEGAFKVNVSSSLLSFTAMKIKAQIRKVIGLHELV